MELQQAGNMMGRKLLEFSRLLVKLMGFSITNGKPVTMKKLANRRMPSYAINMVTVESGGKQVKRQCYIVDSICDIITHQMQALFGNGLFVLSSTCTQLSDNVIMVRFSSDKGGKFMQFKFGLSIMNFPCPNSADAFDILATLDAFDMYANFQVAIFQKLDKELQQFFF